VDSNKNSGYS